MRETTRSEVLRALYHVLSGDRVLSEGDARSPDWVRRRVGVVLSDVWADHIDRMFTEMGVLECGTDKPNPCGVQAQEREGGLWLVQPDRLRSAIRNELYNEATEGEATKGGRDPLERIASALERISGHLTDIDAELEARRTGGEIA